MRRVYVKQVTEYLETFEYEELKEYLPYIEPYFANEKYTDEQLTSYIKLLSQPTDIVKDWSERKKNFDDDNERNIQMFLRFVNKNAEIWKDKKTFFLTVFDGRVTAEIAKYGEVVAFDFRNHAIFDTILQAIKNDVYVNITLGLNPRRPNPCDHVVGFHCFNDPPLMIPYFEYLQRMENEGKTLYLVSTRILNGTHPTIKLDKKPNIIYNESTDGIERAVFNGIQTEA